ncbi:hypothetical protein SARC_00659 [Sphaeroforma arctica JP610]|uniref:U3 small nucleolar ribonucleoprotein protein MPP10 n=1 Tax=Sphaeroforma arctica JP610 TaxID=667725 RepID=A0A0L0GE97_9EUKA|nr:hypothetical protein SARC_00659 [Sphaeroforma arctica JP610]KNC87224.1 hypothetical protein SARC_00659 [Sphaeroforma arctica JP610]|eukprot:XP_014161126.1 hypothetical protein SARC_00659 [Sphaeroforma arctica JP610]
MVVSSTLPVPTDVLGSEEIESVLNDVLVDPTVFVNPKASVAAQLLKVTQQMFDLAVSESVSRDPNAKANTHAGPLECLLTQGFDNDMLWEELQMQNEPMTSYLEQGTEKTLKTAHNEGIILIAQADDEEDSESESDSEDVDSEEMSTGDSSEKDAARMRRRMMMASGDDDEEVANDLEDVSHSNTQQPKRKRGKKSAADDDFFKLSEMNNFLDDMDRLENKRQKRGDAMSDSDGDDLDLEKQSASEGEEGDILNANDNDIDLFATYSEEEDEEFISEGEEENDDAQTTKKGLSYSDFFDKPDGLEEDAKGLARKSKGSSAQFEEIAFDHDDESEEVHETTEDKNDVDGDTDSDSDSDSDIGSEEQEQEGTVRNLLSDDEEEGEQLTEFEKKQAKLRERIKEIEENNLKSKSWQMSGEATSKTRETNSLLQEVLDFDTTMKPVPEITEEVTQSLEDLIRQRIKDDVWDDVERKEALPTHTTRRANYELDMEKSKKGLADVYEEEYMQQVGGAPDAAAIKTKAAQDKVTEMYMHLCSKLDALANFHFTPARAKEDVEIIVNKPALAMEEILPTATSTVQQLAPEEAYRKSRQELKGADEKTESDRARERKAKKADKRQKNKERDDKMKKLEKSNPALAHKLNKKSAMSDIKKGKVKGASSVEPAADTRALKSSTAFFSQLQDEARATIKGTVAAKGPPKERRNNASAAFKL